MRTTTFFLILLLTGLACLESCKKDSVGTEPRFKKGDVLLVGEGLDTNGHFVAAYWNNNVMTRLSDDQYNLAGLAMASAFAVSGNDMYVAGYVVKGPGSFQTAAAYWKNGQLTILDDIGSTANSIFISGTDVYIAGTVGRNGLHAAVYWKNGVLNVLASDPLRNSDAGSVFVSGNDVYVSGNAADSAVYWKNNVRVQLTGGAISSYSTGMFVAGTDIYNCGGTLASAGHAATIWKNGIPSFPETTIANSISEIYAMTVSGNDVYAVGFSIALNGGAGYWKNGKAVTFDNSAGYNITANCITVSGSDVYVGGDSGPYGGVATIWKNGVETKINDFGTINGIYIVP